MLNIFKSIYWTQFWFRIQYSCAVGFSFVSSCSPFSGLLVQIHSVNRVWTFVSARLNSKAELHVHL